MFDMNSGSKLHLEEWIPTEYNEKQTLRAVRKRSQIPSQRDNFPSAFFNFEFMIISIIMHT
jgi:hypothetical protein